MWRIDPSFFKCLALKGIRSPRSVRPCIECSAVSGETDPEQSPRPGAQKQVPRSADRRTRLVSDRGPPFVPQPVGDGAQPLLRFCGTAGKSAVPPVAPFQMDHLDRCGSGRERGKFRRPVRCGRELFRCRDSEGRNRFVRAGVDQQPAFEKVVRQPEGDADRISVRRRDRSRFRTGFTL